MTFPASRAAALARLEDFMPRAGHYAFATGGVLPFWARLRKTLAPNSKGGGNDSPEQQSLIDFPHERCR
jgi:hypothetical protein